MQNEEIPIERSEPYKPKRQVRKRIKYRLRSRLGTDSPVYRLLQQSWFLFLRSKWKLQTLTGNLRGNYSRNVDVDKTYRVSPQKIIFTSLKEFGFRDFNGHILGGDWDRLDKRFDTLDIYIAIKQVCLEGKSWADTLFYQRFLADLKKGHIRCGCQDERDLKNRCQSIESLYRTIQHEGYKSQRDLLLAGLIQEPLVAKDEVTVSIGRDGDLLFSDGAHRLAIAKLLGVSCIPVTVAVRHSNWIKFRNELLSFARNETDAKDKRLYQPVTHPDLADLPAFHDCKDRFKLINDTMSVRQGSLLDIGANLGYFCHRFEEQGFDCYAVENHSPTVYFLKRLARAENRRFKIITESILDSQEIRNTHFDIVLALNIFHHFLKTKEYYEKLIDLLKNLHMAELFFEAHLPEEPQMQGAYNNYSPDEFVQFITRNSSLKKADLIGTMKDGRHLYRLF